MNHGDGGKPRGGRQMTPDEAELWRRLAHSVDKVKAKPRVAAHGEDAATGTVPAPASAPQPTPRAASSRRPSMPSPPPSPPLPPQPARPAELDRRTVRQVASGKVTIDASLDLHGLHQEAAHARLRAFLVSCQANGNRMVLVITGKGGGRPIAPDLHSDSGRGGELSDPSRRGVLRRSVPQWLDQPEFRAIVLSYAAAGVRHGGEGALYIRLRKPRGG